uniref:(northern house mosquito) hypothetical protein n=1 Tax=Culex pipiens TaxID=7175 RepID=A0A8D8AMR3_CULPI
MVTFASPTVVDPPRHHSRSPQRWRQRQLLPSSSRAVSTLRQLPGPATAVEVLLLLLLPERRPSSEAPARFRRALALATPRSTSAARGMRPPRPWPTITTTRTGATTKCTRTLVRFSSLGGGFT